MNPPDPTAGERLIRAERQRQITQEGYTPDHDREHGGFALSQAAYCYKALGLLPLGALPDQWPWDRESWKPRDPISNLIRAGALYLAAAEVGYPGATESAQRCAALLDASIVRLTPASPPAVAASTGTSEDVEALAGIVRPWALCDDGGRFDHGSERAARAVLASDWLAAREAAARAEANQRADTAFLVGARFGRESERERIAQAIEALPQDDHVVGYQDACDDAARIAREGRP